jgi:hypothetical protein
VNGDGGNHRAKNASLKQDVAGFVLNVDDGSFGGASVPNQQIGEAFEEEGT